MRYFKQLAAVVLASQMILPPAPLLAGTRKGDKLRNDARTEELKGNYSKAYELTSQAVGLDPADPSYTLQLHRIRFEWGGWGQGGRGRRRLIGRMGGMGWSGG